MLAGVHKYVFAFLDPSVDTFKLFTFTAEKGVTLYLVNLKQNLAEKDYHMSMRHVCKETCLFPNLDFFLFVSENSPMIYII